MTEAFSRLVDELRRSVTFLDVEPDFSGYDTAPKTERELLRKTVFVMHQRITFLLASRKIHTMLDQRTTRIQLGERLNSPEGVGDGTFDD